MANPLQFRLFHCFSFVSGANRQRIMRVQTFAANSVFFIHLMMDKKL